MRALAMVLTAAALTMSCSESDKPSAAPTPPIAQVGGAWAYIRTLTSVSGDDCVSALLESSVGEVERGTLEITQTGTSLTAIGTSDGTGLRCSYTGSVGADEVSLNGTQCTPGVIRGIRCADGARHDASIQAVGIAASVSGGYASGTSVETWTITTAAGAGAGVVMLRGSFSATK